MANAAPTLLLPSDRYDQFRQQRTFVENFEDYVSGRIWTLTTADSATAVLQAATGSTIGGVLLYPPLARPPTMKPTFSAPHRS